MGLFDGTSLQRPVTCEHCGKPCAAPPDDSPSTDDRCACPRDGSGTLCLPKDQHPRVRRERRRGKWCTVIADLDAPAGNAPTSNDAARTKERKALLKALRTTLGTGGGLATSKDNNTDAIILQGDHRDAVVRHLCEMGYNAKAAGG